MRSRTVLYLAIALILLVLALAGLRNFGVETQREDVSVGTLDRQAREAKRKGESAVSGGGIDVLREHFESLDTAISLHTVILGVPVASVSQPSPERAHVETWYKARILETLSEPAPQPGAEDFVDSFLRVDRAPATLLPPASDEILLVKAGGSIVIDGVRITQVDTDFPDLVLGQTYLVFLTVGSTRQVADAPYGGGGILAVTDQGLAVIVGRSGLADELRTSAGNDLSRVRDLLRTRRPPNELKTKTQPRA